MSGLLRNHYPSPSRRAFLTTAVGASGAMLLGPAWLKAAADGVDPRVAQVMSKTIGIDMHNHVYPAGTEPRPQGGQPRRQEEPQQAPDLSLGEEVKRSGLTAVCELRAGFRAKCQARRCARQLPSLAHGDRRAVGKGTHSPRAEPERPAGRARPRATNDRPDGRRVTLHRGAPGPCGRGIQTRSAAPSTASR